LQNNYYGQTKNKPFMLRFVADKPHYRVFCNASAEKSKNEKRSLGYSPLTFFSLVFVQCSNCGGNKRNAEQVNQQNENIGFHLPFTIIFRSSFVINTKVPACLSLR